MESSSSCAGLLDAHTMAKAVSQLDAFLCNKMACNLMVPLPLVATIHEISFVDNVLMWLALVTNPQQAILKCRSNQIVIYFSHVFMLCSL